MNNLKALADAATIHGDRHDGLLPPAESWNDDLLEPLAEMAGGCGKPVAIPHCPGVRSGKALPTYAMNDRVEGTRPTEVTRPWERVLFFESVPGRNLHGGPELFPSEPRHERGYAVCYVDGHVGFVLKSEIGKLRW